MNNQLSATVVADALNLLKGQKFPYKEPDLVLELIMSMCANNDQVMRLALRTTELFNEWPGPIAFRAVASSLFTPADGKEAVCPEVDAYSEKRRIEVETERTQLKLAAAKSRLLSAGQPVPEEKALLPGQVSQDQSLAIAVQAAFGKIKTPPPVTAKEAADEAPNWLRDACGLPPKKEVITALSEPTRCPHCRNTGRVLEFPQGERPKQTEFYCHCVRGRELREFELKPQPPEAA